MIGATYPGQMYPGGVPTQGGTGAAELILGSLGSHASMWDGQDRHDERIPGGRGTHELYGTAPTAPAEAPLPPPHHEFY